MLKLTIIHCSRVTGVSAYKSSCKQKTSCHRTLQTSDFLLWRALEQNLYCEDMQDLIVWIALCYTASAGSDELGTGRNKRGARLTAKKSGNEVHGHGTQ